MRIYPLLLVLFSFASALISFLSTSANKRKQCKPLTFLYHKFSLCAGNISNGHKEDFNVREYSDALHLFSFAKASAMASVIFPLSLGLVAPFNWKLPANFGLQPQGGAPAWFKGCTRSLLVGVSTKVGSGS